MPGWGCNMQLSLKVMLLSGLLALSQIAITQMVLAESALSDPTKPAAAALMLQPANTEVNAPLTLSGIQTNGKHSVAIINQTMLRIGDQLQGFTLVAVQPGKAVLKDAEHQTVVLTLALPTYQRPVASSKPKHAQAHKSRKPYAHTASAPALPVNDANDNEESKP